MLPAAKGVIWAAELAELGAAASTIAPAVALVGGVYLTYKGAQAVDRLCDKWAREKQDEIEQECRNAADEWSQTHRVDYSDEPTLTANPCLDIPPPRWVEETPDPPRERNSTLMEKIDNWEHFSNEMDKVIDNIAKEEQATEFLLESLKHCLQIVGGAVAFSTHTKTRRLSVESVQLYITRCAVYFEHICRTIHEQRSESDRNEDAWVMACQIAKLIRFMRKRLLLGSLETLDDDDEREKKKELRCVHWNCCGLLAQFGYQLGFLLFVLVLMPDVIMLNELKTSHFMVIQAVAMLVGYKAVFVASTSPNRRAIRGSAILFRMRKDFTMTSADCGRTPPNERGVSDFEWVTARFSFQSRPISFTSCYLNRETESAVHSALQTLRQQCAASGLSIVAGDLNLRKEKWMGRVREAGFHDCLDPTWKTNKKGESSTAIDYVMVPKGQEHHLRVHRPVQPPGKDLHFPVVFDVGFGINPSGLPCQNLGQCGICGLSGLSEEAQRLLQ